MSVMRYLDLIVYAFVQFVIWYSAVLLFGIVITEVVTCPDQNRFVKSEPSGAVYVCDRDGDIARSNAVLRKQPPPVRRGRSPHPSRPGA